MRESVESQPTRRPSSRVQSLLHDVPMGLANLWRDRFAFLLGRLRGHRASSSADIYSETAYRDLVHREVKRSERSDQLCRILLVYRTDAQGLIVPLDLNLTNKTIRALSSKYRDTDYIGWYRQGRILGVLLTALHQDSAKDGYDILKIRVMDTLGTALRFTRGHSLQICVLEPGELTAFTASDHPAQSSSDCKR